MNVLMYLYVGKGWIEFGRFWDMATCELMQGLITRAGGVADCLLGMAT